MLDKSLLGARVVEMLDLAESNRAYLDRQATRMQIRHNELLAAAIVGLAQQVLEPLAGNGCDVPTCNEESLQGPISTATFRYRQSKNAKVKGRRPKGRTPSKAAD
jgi:hypothetical protein